MKRILVLMHYMELGGAESALLGLLQAHDPERAQIDVFIFDHRGELMPYIPKDKVCLLPAMPAYSMLERPIFELVKQGYWRLAVARLIGRERTKRYARNNHQHLDDATGFTYQQHETVRVLPQINPEVEYNLVISFITPHYVALDKVHARKKLGWIHTDYTNIFINPKMELEMWSRLDYIASISPEVGEKFLSVFPTLQDKVIPIENILSSAFIRQRAEELMPKDMPCLPNVINLLSIGRFCYPKRFDQLGTIARYVADELRNRDCSLQFHWYLIGYGSEEEEQKIRQNLKQEGMEEYVIILGKRENPYPYIKSCDLYVQPSRYEGKSITVREAQILCRPVIVTNYPTSASQIMNETDGVIVPFDNEGCAKGIVDLMLDKKKQEFIMEHLKTHDFGNECEIEKIYQLLE